MIVSHRRDLALTDRGGQKGPKICWPRHHRTGEQPDSQVGDGEGGVWVGARHGSCGSHSLPHSDTAIQANEFGQAERQTGLSIKSG